MEGRWSLFNRNSRGILAREGTSLCLTDSAYDCLDARFRMTFSFSDEVSYDEVSYDDHVVSFSHHSEDVAQYGG